MKLTQRLEMTASLVEKGKRLDDIGTDHAYLPVFLVLNNTVPEAIASDLRKGPLENARATVKEYLLEDKIELRLSDGFDNYYPSEADNYVLAGMGGILMTELVRRTDWLKNPDLKLIFQPQSHSHILRKYLCENGFEIRNELTCSEGRRLYTAFDCIFTGRAETYSEHYYYFGNLESKNDPVSVAFVKKQKDKLEKEMLALKNSGNDWSKIETILKG